MTTMYKPPRLNSQPYYNGGFTLPGGGGFQFNPNEQYDIGMLGKKRQNKIRNKFGLSEDQDYLSKDQIGNNLRRKIAGLGGKSFNPSFSFTADPNSQSVYDSAQKNSLDLINQGFTEENDFINDRANKESEAFYDRGKARLDRGLMGSLTGIRNNFAGMNAPGVMTGGLGNVIGEKAIRPYADSLNDLSNNTEIARRGIVDSMLGNRRAGLASLQAVNPAYMDAGGIVGIDRGLAQNQFQANYGLQRDQLQQQRWQAMMNAYMQQQQIDAAKAAQSPFGNILGAIGGGLLGGLIPG